MRFAHEHATKIRCDFAVFEQRLSLVSRGDESGEHMRTCDNHLVKAGLKERLGILQYTPRDFNVREFRGHQAADRQNHASGGEYCSRELLEVSGCKPRMMSPERPIMRIYGPCGHGSREHVDQVSWIGIG